jgi:hypothetical protein
MEEYKMYWQKIVGDEQLKIDLKKVENYVRKAFEEESDNYKQKLVFNLLEAVKNNDQKTFFYLLLKSINIPKENFKEELWKVLEEYYDIMPEEAFINFAYTIIIGIMATYKGGE